MRNQWLKIVSITMACACLAAQTACEKLDTPEEMSKEETEKPETQTPTNTTEKESSDGLYTRKDTILYVESRGRTEETSYTVSDVRNIIPHYLKIYGIKPIINGYISGFIVGYIPQRQQYLSKTVFAAGQVKTNIVLADSPDEIDYNKCIAIQLTTSTPDQKKTREGLNLFNHPENLGRYVTVCGHIQEYMHAMGVKGVKDAIIYLEE